MLTRPNDSDDSGRGLIAMTFPPPPLADGDNNKQTGVFSSAPAWSSSSSSPPSFSSISPSPSCSPVTFALSYPPPISSMPPTSVSFPSPQSSVDCPLLSLPADSSITLFSCHSSKYNSNSFPSHSPVCLPSSSSSTTSSTHSSASSPFFSPPLSSSSSPITSSSILSSPPFLPHTAPVLPPVPPPCCSCSTLLPRLLSAHRLEVRRLLRSALATLSRRLDSLERRNRRNVRRKRSRQTEEEGRAPSSHAPATSPLSPSLTDEEEDEDRKRKRRKKQRDISHSFKNREEDEVEQDEGRFVVRMAVSFGGEVEGAPLLLHHLNHSRRADSGSTPPEKVVTVYRPNGFRTPPVLQLSISSSSSQRSLHLMPSAHSSPSETLEVSSGRWRFSNILLPCSILSNHRAVQQWLRSSTFTDIRPTILLKMSAVAAEKILESLRGRSCRRPLRPLKDWTAPPSLSTDHCYMRTLSLSSPSDVVRHQKQRNSHRLHLPQRRLLALSQCFTNGPSALLPNGQTIPGTVVEPNKERGKRVSQIRIRRGPPRETPLTPMGLPKVKRLKKKEFSLEEIYTNKNYKSPTSNRTLETIFEEPREKDGALLRIGHQKRRRLLLFPDFTQPRKRKRPPGIGLPVASMPKKRGASRRCHGSSPVEDESDVDVMLVERLSALEDFLTQQGLDV